VLGSQEKAWCGAMTKRRLAAILAADVVGFSSIMESDEEGTLARLKCIEREGHRQLNRVKAVFRRLQPFPAGLSY
jgi:uncharacterized protein YjhX (UPF0386 family)